MQYLKTNYFSNHSCLNNNNGFNIILIIDTKHLLFQLNYKTKQHGKLK